VARRAARGDTVDDDRVELELVELDQEHAFLVGREERGVEQEALRW
jgi:hypothetical protein